MDLGLNGKVALVTGSSSGIGKEIAKILEKEGCSVILNGRDLTKLKSVANEFREGTMLLQADITDYEECKKITNRILEKFGRLDILVCNVGSGRSVKPGEESPKEWQEMIQTNFFSTTNMIEASADVLAKFNGTIVCISSIAGIGVTGAPVTYSASKAALNMYVKCISRPLASRGIRINVVAPGNIMFSGSVWEKKVSDNRDAVEKMLEKEVALKRFGTPLEIANFVVFLASPASSFSTGEIFIVDGGQTK